MTLSDLRNLELATAGNWPAPLKAVAVVLVAALVGFLGYYFKTQELLDELARERSTEQDLRAEFQTKQRVKANIQAYRAQLEELQGMLDVMLQQLPTGTEMPDLLEVISNTGRINGLTFELFKPEEEQPKEFYAAKPITLRAQATYHQFGAFVSSISALSRIVTLENANLVAAARQDRGPQAQNLPDDLLAIDATLQTYRYLEEEAGATEAAGGAAP